MDSIILQAETLNLPDIFAFKLRGKKVELVDNGDSILISPVKQDDADASNEALKALEDFRKYKGIIPHEVDEKIELAQARDEKYANIT